jgi:hypothetical protein
VTRKSFVVVVELAALVTFLGRASQAQEVAWQRTLGGEDHDEARSGQRTADGGTILAGWTQSYGAGGYDFWLIKIAPEETAVEEEAGTGVLAGPFALRQNAPNPLNARTTIGYVLPQPGNATLGVYALTGRRTATVFSGYRQAGVHQPVWDAGGLASGVYCYRLQAGGPTETRRIVLLK